MAEKVLIKPDAAANDDPLVTPERTARVAALRAGRAVAHADYPCIDRLRHFLAVSFLEEIAQRRARDRNSS